jgi:hypothetical protein
MPRGTGGGTGRDETADSRDQLRGFASPKERAMKEVNYVFGALEEEMRHRGGGYNYIAGAWKGTYDEDPSLTE